MLTNFHTHTRRCLHAFGTEEDYVQEAVIKGVKKLGFSDHGPFPDHDFGLRMPFAELNDYLKEIERLKVVYQGKIQLYKGLEIEYHPRYREYYRQLLTEFGLDYLALGEHQFTAKDGTVKNIFFAQSTEDYLEYADAVCEGMRTGYFQFVAHPDLMFLNNLAPDENTLLACERILDCAAETHTVLEYNANGFRRERKCYPEGLRYPYPYAPFWEMVRERKLPVIVGADCHSPQQVCDFTFLDAISRAQETGLYLVNDIFEMTNQD